MWLINASNLSLELFYGDSIPSYAILSHTWADDEVPFQEFVEASTSRNTRITSKAGYRKIMATCEQALRDGLCYVWVDTCCIDKASSAELTEAINSMFRWYRGSQICYAYLSDFDADAQVAEASTEQAQDHFSSAFRRCRWFTRGWCLQELLAPRQIRFLNRNWQAIGTKCLHSRLIAEITGIPETVLTTPPRNKIWDFPVATRISWIGRRHTTRTEDIAYSLLGILDVNMPMLYGEGIAAFSRLQGEIIRKYNDLSIFSWVGQAKLMGFMPILAPVPRCFLADTSPIPSNQGRTRSRLESGLITQFSLTNQGIFFPNAKLQYQNAVPGYRHQYVLDLCYRSKKDSRRYLLLQKVGPGLFVRLLNDTERQNAFRQAFISGSFYEPVCIPHNIDRRAFSQIAHWESYAVRLRWKPWEKLGQQFWHIRAAEPRASWDLAANQFLLNIARPSQMHVEFVPGNYETNPDRTYFVIVISDGGENIQSPARVSARIVSAETWLRMSRTAFRFGETGGSKPPFTSSTEDSVHISLAGHDITISMQLVREKDQAPYHHVYLDWKKSESFTEAVLPETTQL